jgi:hypothetical protein
MFLGQYPMAWSLFYANQWFGGMGALRCLCRPMSMRMQSLRLGFVLAVLSAACNATASWAPLTVEEQVEGSDAIAVVTITGTRAVTNGHYRSFAIARVEDALKGVREDSITLLFNSTSSAEGRDPQSYSKGERCLMFMSRVSEGKYITFQSVFGKHLIKHGMVELSDGHRVWTQTLEATMKEILAFPSKKQRPAEPGAAPNTAPPHR